MSAAGAEDCPRKLPARLGVHRTTCLTCGRALTWVAGSARTDGHWKHEPERPSRRR